MTTVAVLNRECNPVGEVALNDAIFANQINVPVMHQAVLVYLASLRRGTHATKTKGMVSGGGKKPWRQKGTGRARTGSTRNPIWRGGGIVFGPQPRSHNIAMPKKMRRVALLSALSMKAAEEKIVVFEELDFSAPKTKEIAAILQKIAAGNALLVVDADAQNLMLSARNIPTVSVEEIHSLNTYQVLRHDKLVFTKDSLSLLGEVLI